MRICILLTCYNRKQKTLNCINSLYNSVSLSLVAHQCDIYLTDDNSVDGTSEELKLLYPDITIIKGNGELFWAGGMRVAFKKAQASGKSYDYYLPLNDDVELFENAIEELFTDIEKINRKEYILIGSTVDKKTNNFTYGGRKLRNNYNIYSNIVIPNNIKPQLCDLGNANIMLIPSDVIKRIGFFSEKYTHGIADYDYTLRAKKNSIPTYVSSKFLAFCQDDHGNNWRSSSHHSLKERVKFLKSVKGLSYKEYLIYIKEYFPLYFPRAWAQLWLKTLFPFFWDKIKTKTK